MVQHFFKLILNFNFDIIITYMLRNWLMFSFNRWLVWRKVKSTSLEWWQWMTLATVSQADPVQVSWWRNSRTSRPWTWEVCETSPSGQGRTSASMCLSWASLHPPLPGSRTTLSWTTRILGFTARYWPTYSFLSVCKWRIIFFNSIVVIGKALNNFRIYLPLFLIVRKPLIITPGINRNRLYW